MNMGTKKRLIGAAAALAMLTGLAEAASAGEITGNGKTGQNSNSNSDCSYSGLEDFEGEAPVDPGVTQSWGQIPKAERDFLASIGVSPSALCNGHLNPLK